MRDINIFNRDGHGAEEIVAAVGLISSSITFDKWEPLLPFGIREVTGIVGPEVYTAISAFYAANEKEVDPAMTEALRYMQQAVAFFTWLRIIPTLDAQHDIAGRSKRLGENEKGLTALQEFKDEENILRLAYEAVDALVECLERNEFKFWLDSRKYRIRRECLIRSKEDFDEYYYIGSHRLFVTLLPIMREVQQSQVAPVLGDAILRALLDGNGAEDCEQYREPASRAVALLTMQKAVERLPVEVIPEGVVQVQQSQPVKSRLRAEQEARAAVAASLGEDARRILERLQLMINDATASGDGSYTPGPIVHSKGMTF